MKVISDRSIRVVGQALIVAVPITAAGCGDDGPTGPAEEELTPVTVDASEDWVYVDLAEPAATVEVDDPGESSTWDVGFFATSVMMNGGEAGPAGVVGHCICQNADASDSDVMSMTEETELPAFDAVAEADIPTGEGAWAADTLVPAIEGWYSYDMSTHTVSAAPENVWKVRTADGGSYAKFHVIGLEDATQQHAGRIEIEFAVQEEAGGAMSDADTAVVDVSDGAAHFGLSTGGTVSAGDDWDLRFEGYTIRVNGGVSGSGAAGAVSVDSPFDAVDDASDLSAGHYRGDAYGGVFAENPWYRYDLDGQHQVWPTYDVYLVKRDSEVWKIQLTGYYGDTGDSRHITLRYAKLTD